jgi:hypothetical protein
MSKRTWTCVPCRKSYRRKQSITSVECPSCHGPCESVHCSVRIPSPKQIKEWDEFWTQYKADKALREDIERVDREFATHSPRTKKPSAKPRVAYVDGICAPLIKTLNHSAALPTHQLAGHAANVEFWISEAKHCLTVIDGYQVRFDRLRAGQAAYEERHEVVNTSAPIRRGTKDQARQELRRAVGEAIERFLVRSHQEGLLSDKDLKAAFGSLGK